MKASLITIALIAVSCGGSTSPGSSPQDATAVPDAGVTSDAGVSCCDTHTCPPYLQCMQPKYPRRDQ